MTNIGLKHAVQNVRKYVDENQDIFGKNIGDLRIEETELSEDGKFWSITVSFNREVDPRTEKVYVYDRLSPNSLFSQIQNVADIIPKKQTFIIERDYKIFKVNAKTGEIISMKMYKS